MKVDIEFVKVLEGNLSDKKHQAALIELTNAYLCDQMGGGNILSPDMERKLIQGLAECPTMLLFFAEYQSKLVGLATCFTGFSTFYAKKLVNIHDLIVLPEYRRQGIAEKILLFLEEKAKFLGCCKLTLEVRADNIKAMALYKKLGFGSGEHAMYFWTKIL